VLELVNVSVDGLLRGISLRVEREHCILLGRTGSGKSTLLEVIAGLRSSTTGRIFIGGRDVTELPPEKRNVGYLPQDLALFPHLNVRENIEFGLRFRGVGREEIDRRVEEVCEMLDIGHLLTKRVTKISGGEKQRVALARALILKPEVLLMDEPFSALDFMTKAEIFQQFKAVESFLPMSILHVTHNLEDALRLGSRFYVITEGRVVEQKKSELVHIFSFY